MMAMICGREGHSGSARRARGEAPSRVGVRKWISRTNEGGGERGRRGARGGGMQKSLFYEEASLRSERRKRGLIIQISGSARTDERTNARWGERRELLRRSKISISRYFDQVFSSSEAAGVVYALLCTLSVGLQSAKHVPREGTIYSDQTALVV